MVMLEIQYIPVLRRLIVYSLPCFAHFTNKTQEPIRDIIPSPLILHGLWTVIFLQELAVCYRPVIPFLKEILGEINDVVTQPVKP